MEKVFNKANELVDSLNQYVNNRIESVKLNIAEKSSAAFSFVVAGAVVAGVFLLFFIFLSIALAIGIGEWTGRAWLGYLLTGCLHLLFGILVWVNRVRLIQLPMMNAMIKQIFNEPDEKDKEHTSS